MVKVVQARPLNKNETSLINTCAILSTFMYLDTQDERYTGRTIKDLLSDDYFRSNANEKYLNTIRDAVLKNPSLGDIAILSQSAIDNLNIPEGAPYSGFGPELVVANTFVLENGDLCVAYRGTGAGKWIDNGQAFGQENTVMQEAAVRYFDYVYEEYGRKGNAKIYVTGHSKGGNEAQYVCMAAEHNGEISHCYEFDGQGFSPEAIGKFKEINGEHIYNLQVDKITAICGKNDFVSPLGISIAKPENTYYIATVNSAINISGYHDILYMFNQESPDRINFKYNSIGDAISIEQGNFGRCAANISDKVMKMDVEDRKDCSITMMSICEKFFGGERGTGDIQKASIGHIITFYNKGIPLLGNAIIDKSTADSVFGLCKKLIDEGSKDKKFGKIFGAVAIGSLYAGLYVVAVPLSKVINTVSILTNAAVRGIKEIGEKIKERKALLKQLEEDLEDKIMQEYYERIGASYGYDTRNKNFRKDWNIRMASLETGVPELAVVVAASSLEQYLYQEKEIEKGHDSHVMINYIDIVSELGTKYGNGIATEDIQKKALYIAEHRAIECIKRGENVMLFLPDMYEPAFRAKVNQDISKALKNTKYTSTAIVLDNTNEHMFKYMHSKFATFMEQKVSSYAKDLLEKYPPSTDDPYCKYDFVVSDSLNNGQIRSLSELDPEEARKITEYLDALDNAYKEVFGNYNLDEYEIEEYYNSIKEDLEEDLAEEVNILTNEEYDDYER